VRNAVWTIHFGQLPVPCGNLSPVAEYRFEMFPATSTRWKWNGTPFFRGSLRLQRRCATVS
jgi:hypothetical protein